MMETQVPLAELLIRRTELKAQLARIEPIHARDLFELQVKRVSVTDSVDEVSLGVPQLTFGQVDAAWNHYSAQLRRIDALIQKTNWTTQVPINPQLLEPFVEPQTEK